MIIQVVMSVVKQALNNNMLVYNVLVQLVDHILPGVPGVWNAINLKIMKDGGQTAPRGP